MNPTTLGKPPGARAFRADVARLTPEAGAKQPGAFYFDSSRLRVERGPGTRRFLAGLDGKAIVPARVRERISSSSRLIWRPHFLRMAGTSRPCRITATITMQFASMGS